MEAEDLNRVLGMASGEVLEFDYMLSTMAVSRTTLRICCFVECLLQLARTPPPIDGPEEVLQAFGCRMVADDKLCRR